MNRIEIDLFVKLNWNNSRPNGNNWQLKRSEHCLRNPIRGQSIINYRKERSMADDSPSTADPRHRLRTVFPLPQRHAIPLISLHPFPPFHPSYFPHSILRSTPTSLWTEDRGKYFSLFSLSYLFSSLLSHSSILSPLIPSSIQSSAYSSCCLPP